MLGSGFLGFIKLVIYSNDQGSIVFVYVYGRC